MGPAIRVEDMRAGHRYEITWGESPLVRPVPIGTVRNVIVTYDHLDRFGSQAVAGCGSSATGVDVRPPFRLP